MNDGTETETFPEEGEVEVSAPFKSEAVGHSLQRFEGPHGYPTWVAVDQIVLITPSNVGDGVDWQKNPTSVIGLEYGLQVQVNGTPDDLTDILSGRSDVQTDLVDENGYDKSLGY